MTWGHLIACGIGALLVISIPWILRRFKGNTDTLSGYTEEQADKERERIIAHADSFRDRIAEETKKGHSEIDDF